MTPKNKKTVEVVAVNDRHMRQLVKMKYPGYVVDRSQVVSKTFRVRLRRRKK